MSEKAKKPSHGALWEVLLIFEAILLHFEDLEKRRTQKEFRDNPRIESSITLAWQKTKEFYNKTDLSPAWITAVVLYPRWKWSFFESNWTQQNSRFVKDAKLKVKKWWEDDYKTSATAAIRAQSPTPPTSNDYLENLFNSMAPEVFANPSSSRAGARTSIRRDQYMQYIDEPTTTQSPREYWEERSKQWPELAAMALDLMAVPAMSSECERVFSSVAKMTTPESAKLLGKTLWSQQCLKNWQKRGAIELSTYKNAAKVDHGVGE